MPQQPSRTTRKPIFGMKVVDVERFVLALVGLIGFLVTVLGLAIRFFIQQDYNEQQHQAERATDKKISSLETSLEICNSTKNILTKDDLETFQENLNKNKKNEKK